MNTCVRTLRRFGIKNSRDVYYCRGAENREILARMSVCSEYEVELGILSRVPNNNHYLQVAIQSVYAKIM